MSNIVDNPFRRAGRPRNEKQYRVALEYIMMPAPRPYGLLTSLAHGNGLSLNQLNCAVMRIKERAKK